MLRKWNDVRIIPYTRNADGEWSIPDHIIMGLWDQMEREGTAKKVFCEQKIVTDYEFLEWMQLPTNLSHLQVIDGQPALIAWLNGIIEGKALCHFNVFKRFWGHSEDVVGRSIGFIKSLKNREGTGPFLRMLLGFIPESNRLALRLVKKIGFTVVGTVPEMIWDGYQKKFEGLTICYLRD